MELVTDVLSEIRRHLSGKMTVWPHEQDEVVRAALGRLKEALPEAAVPRSGEDQWGSAQPRPSYPGFPPAVRR